MVHRVVVGLLGLDASSAVESFAQVLEKGQGRVVRKVVLLSSNPRIDPSKLRPPFALRSLHLVDL